MFNKKDSKPTILILVTSGEYSDYRVRGVFSSKEKADSFKKDFPGEFWNDDELIELDKRIVVPAGRKPFYIEMCRDGKVGEIKEKRLDLDIAEETNKERERIWFIDWVWVEGKRLSLANGEERLCAYFWAKDKQHAVKIANEKRVQIIAMNQWGKYTCKKPDRA